MQAKVAINATKVSVCGCDSCFSHAELLFTGALGFLGHRSNKFIVGLTNTYPALLAPVLWDYTLCGQYPGTVPDGATVTVQCTNAYNRRLRFRYVIVQFPLIDDWMNLCEIEVFTIGMPIVIGLRLKVVRKLHNNVKTLKDEK